MPIIDNESTAVKMTETRKNDIVRKLDLLLEEKLRCERGPVALCGGADDTDRPPRCSCNAQELKCALCGLICVVIPCLVSVSFLAGVTFAGSDLDLW